MKRMKNKYEVHDLVLVDGESLPIRSKLNSTRGWRYFVGRKWIWEANIQPDFAKEIPTDYTIE